MFGILNIDKPTGMTSRDAVNCVQRLVRPVKVGHAGTLDPLATGVLVVCLGPATRLISYVQQMPKTYRATFLLGQRSETEDVEGTIERISDAPVPTASALSSQLEKMTGTIMQRPPAYSAIKVGGRRSYALARKGQAVELAARPVVIHQLRMIDYDYPRLSLEIQCGSGTYVRAIGRDLALSLGTGAVMSELTRTAIGAFRVEQAIAPKELTRESIASHQVNPLEALDRLPMQTLTDDEIEEIRHGRAIELADPLASEELAAVDADGRLLAILTSAGNRLWRPHRNFVAAQ